MSLHGWHETQRWEKYQAVQEQDSESPSIYCNLSSPEKVTEWLWSSCLRNTATYGKRLVRKAENLGADLPVIVNLIHTNLNRCAVPRRQIYNYSPKRTLCCLGDSAPEVVSVQFFPYWPLGEPKKREWFFFFLIYLFNKAEHRREGKK